MCFSGKIKENSRRVKEKVRNRESRERMLLPSLKTKALSLKPRPQPPFSLKRVDSRLSESSCSGELPLPPFLPKRVQRPPFSPKRDPFFSLKYSCSLKRDVGFSTSRPSERLSLGWRMLSHSSETLVAWARLRGYIFWVHQKEKSAWNGGEKNCRIAGAVTTSYRVHIFFFFFFSS